MNSTTSPRHLQPIFTLNTAEMDADIPLDDLEVKSFFFLVFSIMAMIPSLLNDAVVLSPLVGMWILLNLSTTWLSQFPDIEAAQPYIEDWNHGVWKLNLALFEIGMRLSRLIVLVLWMGMYACQFILGGSLAFVLDALVGFGGVAMERYWRVHAAVGDFWRQLKESRSVREFCVYLVN